MSKAQLHPQAQLLLDKIRLAGIPPYDTLGPVVARQYYDKACEMARGSPPVPAQVRDILIPGPATSLRARVYRPRDEANLPILVFFHGGGYTIGSLHSHDAVCRHLSVEGDCIVVAVDYRLAPEHPFPAAPDDAYAATCWVAKHGAQLGGDPQRIAVGGDSAGGNLSAVTCLQAKTCGGPKLVFQLLIYPGTDMTRSFPSHKAYGEGYLLTTALIDWFHDNYLGSQGREVDWMASPLHAADLQGLPPAHVITAGFDPLQDEGIAFGEKLEAAGVRVSFSHYPGMLHGFITQPGFITDARVALTECAGELRRAFGSDQPVGARPD